MGGERTEGELGGHEPSGNNRKWFALKRKGAIVGLDPIHLGLSRLKEKSAPSHRAGHTERATRK